MTTCIPIEERLFKTSLSYFLRLPQVQVDIFWYLILLPILTFQGYLSRFYNQLLLRICGSNDACIAKASSNRKPMLQTPLFYVFLLLVGYSYRSSLRHSYQNVGFEKLVISSTAFQGVDLLHLSKAAKLMGTPFCSCQEYVGLR